MSLGSGAEDFDCSGYARNMGRDVEHSDGECLARESALIVADALMSHAHQVLQVGISRLKPKGSACVRLCVRFLAYPFVGT